MTPTEAALEAECWNRTHRTQTPVTYEGQPYWTDSTAWAEDDGAVVRLRAPGVRLKVPVKDVRPHLEGKGDA